MLYDLNIQWTPKTPQDELERTLRFAKALGYDVVALNNVIQTPIGANVVNPIPQLSAPSQAQANQSNAQPEKKKPLPTVLRRATVVITDPGVTNYKLAEHARAYDMVAVRPTNEKAFTWACVNQDHAGVVSVDLTSSLGFHFHPRTCNAARARGLRFEIAYGQVVQAPAAARSQFIGNVMGLLRATKGRGIMVSSEARSALGLRAPADVVNLLAVWGLAADKGMEALGVVPRAVVVNQGIRRRGFRGMVDIVQTAGPDPTAAEEVDDHEAGKPKTGKNQKRKNGEREGAEGIVGDEQPRMSKRQAKKLKKKGAAEKG